MAKGQIAKDYVTAKLKEVFGADFLGEADKKIYVQAPENGEKIQIAISMTCPKTPVAFSNTPVIRGGMMNFEEEAAAVVTAPSTVVEVSETERETIAEMMKRFGL
jgi:hypothetical protein